MTSEEQLRRELFEWYGEERFPDPPPLNLKVLSKSTFLEYEEWKIEYDVETEETMPVQAGWSVPAYLLVPRNRDKPMPAMICFHQCAEDCVVAKEAVVGKAPWVPTSSWTFFQATGRVSIDRLDQAYGYELVHEGFVVLAPDSINCGERNIEAIRKPGENRLCHQIIDPHLGQEASFKRVTDGLRAVDVLESLDFVDPERIGAAGHSMGAGCVYSLMAFDERVKAGIMGSWSGSGGRFYPLIAPRLLMALSGTFDVEDQNEDQNQRAYDFAHRCYEKVGAPDNLLNRKFPCGHRFVDEFKWEAYKRLKEHFGILPEREPVSLMEVAEEARRMSTSGWEEQHVVFPEVTGQDSSVTVNRTQVVSAIAGLILYLADRSAEVTLKATVEVVAGQSYVNFSCSGDPPISKEPTPSGIESLRGVRQILAEHDATLKWKHSDGELICRVAFASDT